MHNFKELLVWQKAVDLVVKIYQSVEHFPNKEKFNLVSQMERAATSVPSNIAEGCGRNSNPAFKQFIGIALGSSYELETQIIISSRLGYLNEEESNDLLKGITEVQRMLNGLTTSLH
jgi:four helix bundle protein